MATQLPGVVVGSILSLTVSVVVLFVQRHLRERGEVRREVAWTRGGHNSSISEGRQIEAKFLNKKDVGVSLWNIHLEFYKEGERTTCKVPRVVGEVSRGSVGMLNLPSHIGISQMMEVEVEGDNLRAAKEADKVMLAGDIPGGRE